MDNLNADELLQEFNSEKQAATEDDQEVEIKGKKYRASQIAEWEQAGLRQADYTRKTQELAEQRRQMQAQLQEYEQLKNYIGIIQQKDPYFIAQAQRILQGQPANDPYAEDPYMQGIRQTQQQVAAMWQSQQELMTKQNMIELKDELAQLKQKYPKMDPSVVVAAIQADPAGADTDEIARRSHEDMTQRVRQEIESMSEQRKLQRKALVEGSGGRTGGVTQPQPTPKNRAEMEARVAEKMKLLGL